MCCYLTGAHVGQPFPSLLQVTQTGVNHAIRVAGQLAAVLVAGARSSQTLVLRTVGGVAQTDVVLWDAPTNANRISLSGAAGPERYGLVRQSKLEKESTGTQDMKKCLKAEMKKVPFCSRSRSC